MSAEGTLTLHYANLKSARQSTLKVSYLAEATFSLNTLPAEKTGTVVAGI